MLVAALSAVPSLFYDSALAVVGLFGSSPPPPPPPPTLSITSPSSGPYYVGLIFVVVSQLVAIPLCLIAYKLKAGSALPLFLVGIITAILPMFIQPALSWHGLGRSRR